MHCRFSSFLPNFFLVQDTARAQAPPFFHTRCSRHSRHSVVCFFASGVESARVLVVIAVSWSYTHTYIHSYTHYSVHIVRWTSVRAVASAHLSNGSVHPAVAAEFKPRVQLQIPAAAALRTVSASVKTRFFVLVACFQCALPVFSQVFGPNLALLPAPLPDLRLQRCL